MYTPSNIKAILLSNAPVLIKSNHSKRKGRESSIRTKDTKQERNAEAIPEPCRFTEHHILRGSVYRRSLL